MLDANNAIPAAENQDDGDGQNNNADDEPGYKILSTPQPQAQARAQEVLRQAMINFPEHE